MTWSQANVQCTDVGGRLCTLDEINRGCAAGTGCNFDQQVNPCSCVFHQPTTTSTPNLHPHISLVALQETRHSARFPQLPTHVDT